MRTCPRTDVGCNAVVVRNKFPTTTALRPRAAPACGRGALGVSPSRPGGAAARSARRDAAAQKGAAAQLEELLRRASAVAQAHGAVEALLPAQDAVEARGLGPHLVDGGL